MGDRCHVSLTCRQTDFDKELKYHFHEDEKGVGWIKCDEDEANYAYCNELEEWQGKGIPFYGRHDSGGNYGAGLFACDGKELAECSSDDYGCPVCSINDDGSVKQVDLDNVHEYQRVLKEAKRLVGPHVTGG